MTQAQMNTPNGAPPPDVFFANFNIFAVIARPGGKLLLRIKVGEGSLDVDTDCPTAETLASLLIAASKHAGVPAMRVEAADAPKDRGQIDEPVDHVEDNGEIPDAPATVQ